MAVGKRTLPYLAFNFLFEVEGLVVGGFTEVTGLQAELETEDYREGGVNAYLHKLAGPVRYPSNLVLKRGLAEIDELWKWYHDVLRRSIKRRNVSIILLDSASLEKRRWNFERAYPVKWSGPELRANTSAVAIETLELVHHGFIG